MTFVDSDSSSRQSIQCPSSWDDYDILLLVPDITISAKEGQTQGNWLWMKIERTGTATSNNNYNSVGTVGERGVYFTATVLKGWNGDRYYWHYGFNADRGGQMALIDNQDINSENFSDLTIYYGGYYGNTYGVLNGTLKIYGVKLS